MKNIRFIVLIISILIFTNCDINNTPIELDNITSQDSNIAEKNLNSDTYQIKILKTSKANDIVFKISNPIGKSLEDVIIIGANFENKIPITLTEIDPINKIELYDIDNDGFDELFIFTTSAGSGSYGSIYAFTSNKGVGLKPIIVDDFIFDDYSGHDSFYFENNMLIREYPNSDKNIKIKYKLIDNKLSII